MGSCYLRKRHIFSEFMEFGLYNSILFMKSLNGPYLGYVDKLCLETFGIKYIEYKSVNQLKDASLLYKGY
jgi:hypothetical protein